MSRRFITVVMIYRWLPAIVAVSILFGGGTQGRAAAADWASGPALQKRLAGPVDVFFAENPLRQALRGFSKAHHVAVLVDRRVDPDQKLDLKLSSVPLSVAFRKIAESRDLGFSQLGPVAYFGPRPAAARLRTLAALREEEVRRLPPESARKFLQARPLVWEDFATPRYLLTELARQSGVEIRGAEQVPHDLWAAADFPPISLLDRVTLIAIQFDLTFTIAEDGQSIRLAPIPQDLAILRSYSGGRDAEARAAKIAALAPDARVKAVGEKVFVKGLLEDHERIAAPRRPAEPTAKTPVAAGKTRIERLKVQNKPVGLVLEQLAAQLKFELHMDRQALQQAGISLEQQVSIQVEKATLDDVLRELLKTTTLTYRRSGNIVEILAK